MPPLPAFLKPLQPQMRYVLIDEGAYPDETLRGLPQNLAAAIFQAERCLRATTILATSCCFPTR
ncbi:hypothetical protein [Thauera aromatica]|uniref:hypothetical protein n=1 Tax=Thauera aromatica TaxID=59405 RepID=UPI000D170197|nr:hypothetical protein [Thauera aromatica]